MNLLFSGVMALCAASCGALLVWPAARRLRRGKSARVSPEAKGRSTSLLRRVDLPALQQAPTERPRL